MHPWCARTVSVVGLFDMAFVLHVDKVGCVRRLYELFCKYHKRSTEEECREWMSLCGFNLLYNKFYFVREAAEKWRELDFERRQRLNVR